MSEWPSSLKSPVPTAFQADPGLALTTPPPTRLLPFISQIAACPDVFCQRMSERPLSKKSPVPIVFQLGPGLGFTDPPPAVLAPFISQIAACPFAFCHRMFERLTTGPAVTPSGVVSSTLAASLIVPAAVPSEQNRSSLAPSKA